MATVRITKALGLFGRLRVTGNAVIDGDLTVTGSLNQGTPVPVVAGTDIVEGLITLGFFGEGETWPLNMGAGALVAGASTLGATTTTSLAATSITGTGTVALTGHLTVTTGKNFVFDTAGAGTQIGTGGTQKLGLWGATPITQPTRAGQLTDSTTGVSGTNTVAAIGVGAVDTACALAADVRNALATIIARLNGVETIVHNTGLSA